jgi:fucose permease
MISFGLLAGVGAGAIDAGLNTYAAKHFDTRVLNWMHACYGLGAFTGPVLMTAVITSGRSWRLAYGLVALCQLVLAVCFGVTRSRWDEPSERADERSTPTASYCATLRHPATWVGIALFFLYTGVEAGAGIWVYSLFTEARAVPEGTARMCVSVYWGSLAAGRILSGTAAAWLSAYTLLRVSMIGLILGATLVWFRPGDTAAFAGLALMGLSAAPVFPTLISVTPVLVGASHTANVVGFQIGFALLGASLLPSCIGYLANTFGLEVVGPSLFGLSVLLLALWEASHHRRW